MKIVVLASDENWAVFENAAVSVQPIRVSSIQQLFEDKNADAYFNLIENEPILNYENIIAPIFINEVTHTLAQLNAQKNIIRINAWAGFLQKEYWEIAGQIDTPIAKVLQNLQKKYIQVPDEPGFVTARTIAMIINEAYFALEDKVSNEADIDIAMKLGTNYPYGPFEWSKKIGEKSIYNLLQNLSLTSERYTPSLLLKASANLHT